MKNGEVLLHAREREPEKQRAGSRKAAEEHKAAGRAGKRAKAKIKMKTKV